MKIRIVAGGPVSLIPDLKKYVGGPDTIWIGVDRGTFVLIETGIRPKHAFGDFDSVSENEKEAIVHASIHLNVYRSEKDQTDMEIAFAWAMDQDPEEVLLFGATGARLDHELLNIQLLSNCLHKKGTIVKVVDCRNEITLHAPGTYVISQDDRFSYISFLPFEGEVTGITLEGFKYPLQNASLQMGSSLCISNELVNKNGTYSFDSGIIMMVKSRD
ncbi:thiamine diphosphokinase [Bacillus sp. NEB1478]|uniref:thiamine diphosphokinase n=1 Tax=Bacillus sp. NEB1478 TaxID=3073816 RepID=UPI002873DCCB|nr:thiamine diphosphokinase [Bacillus sp. NEB1478]WNB90444.1 thiamine diphosphokinase [Bacillus sp. NEB1478]